MCFCFMFYQYFLPLFIIPLHSLSFIPIIVVLYQKCPKAFILDFDNVFQITSASKPIVQTAKNNLTQKIFLATSCFVTYNLSQRMRYHMHVNIVV